MSDQAWELDFTKTTAEDADLSQGNVPPGWYRAVLARAYDHEKGAKVLEFKICHGIAAGAKILVFLNNPRLQNDQDAMNMASKTVQCYASRLGLASKNSDGKIVQMAFSAAVGPKEYVLRWEAREYNDKNGAKKTAHGVSGFGFDFFPVGHPKMPAEAYQATGLPVPGGVQQNAKTSGNGGGKGTATVPPPPPAMTEEELKRQLFGA